MGHTIFPWPKVYHRYAVKIHEAAFAPASHDGQFHFFSHGLGSRLPDTTESRAFPVCTNIIPFSNLRDLRGKVFIFCFAQNRQILQYLQE